jgi:hypothetical protein
MSTAERAAAAGADRLPAARRRFVALVFKVADETGKPLRVLITQFSVSAP